MPTRGAAAEGAAAVHGLVAAPVPPPSWAFAAGACSKDEAALLMDDEASAACLFNWGEVCGHQRTARPTKTKAKSVQRACWRRVESMRTLRVRAKAFGAESSHASDWLRDAISFGAEVSECNKAIPPGRPHSKNLSRLFKPETAAVWNHHFGGHPKL
jgi:hypothetical protein